MKERVEVSDLTIGMFVAELDRPWLDTPFLLQGFLIESQEDIDELKRHCKYVYIEPEQSTGEAYRPPPKGSMEAQHERAASPVEAVSAAAPAKSRGGLLGTMRRVLLAAFGRGATEESVVIQQPRRSALAHLESVGADEHWRRLSAPGAGISAGELDFLVPRTQHAPASDAAWDGARAPRGAPPGLLEAIRNWFGSGATMQAPHREDDTAEARAPAPVYPELASFDEELPKAREVHTQTRLVVDQIIADIQSSKVIPVRKVQEAVLSMIESVVRNPNSLLWLARLKERDPRAYDHGLNVAVFLLCFGRHLGLPKGLLEILGTAGLMQDVGKLRLPRPLLEKRTPLTPAERETLKTHVKHSIDILESSDNASSVLIEIVAQHHERFDGSGYPNGLKGDEITMLGAMSGIVDTYAAMTSSRPYREPAMPQHALRQLYAWRGTLFNPGLIEKFIQCVGIFPVGSLVELNTGEVAIVMAHSQVRRLKPRLMLILDHTRQPYSAPIVMDLLNDPATPSGEPYRIVRGLQPDVQSSALYDQLSAVEAGASVSSA